MKVKQYEWHICVIAQCTEYLMEYEYGELIDSIKKQLNSGKIRFTVLQYIVPDNINKTGEAYLHEYYQGMAEITPSTTRISNFDLYSNNDLKSFFEYKIVPINTKKISIVLWGHGAGMGYLSFPQQERNNFHQTSPNDSSQKKVAKAGPNAFSNSSNKTYKAISALDFATSLECFGSKKIDLFIAACCYCQSFESGYLLKDRVEIIVAAQTSYPSTSFNYEKLFLLMQNGNSTTIMLAASICNTFKEKYTTDYITKVAHKHTEGFLTEEDIDLVSISANDLTCYESLRCVLNKIAQYLIDNFDVPVSKVSNKTFVDVISEARERCKDLTPKRGYNLIDLSLFLETINYKLLNEGVETMNEILKEFQYLRALTNKALLKQKNPTSYQLPNSNIKSSSPQFLSIFFPAARGVKYTNAELIYNTFYNQEATGLGLLKEKFKWQVLVTKYTERYNPQNL